MFSFCTMSCVVFVYFFASNKFPNLLFRPIKYKLVRFLLDELGIALQMHKDLVRNVGNICHQESNNDVSYEDHNRIEVYLADLQPLIVHPDKVP